MTSAPASFTNVTPPPNVGIVSKNTRTGDKHDSKGEVEEGQRRQDEPDGADQGQRRPDDRAEPDQNPGEDGHGRRPHAGLRLEGPAHSFVRRRVADGSASRRRRP